MICVMDQALKLLLEMSAGHVNSLVCMVAELRFCISRRWLQLLVVVTLAMEAGGEFSGIKSIVDTRAIVGIDKFNGTNEKWQEFLWPLKERAPTWAWTRQ